MVQICAGKSGKHNKSCYSWLIHLDTVNHLSQVPSAVLLSSELEIVLDWDYGNVLVRFPLVLPKASVLLNFDCQLNAA